ncbi:non-specific serine/threonine protein kinase [Neobacillus bataviensis LMG 21833]|uniref:Non-specific serine/threonine protein kinase n=1 Tax=Neobacillus bataviensis LMG 21833 TaxID=1117379 RepID=K6CEY1_9BACI|nr:DEAD/DEAH box helicase [Neobacillus bataviensis]EKN69695.1 non-specific serine/threonine protein kinase [Neobacillus bataviensis LMG 21833]
MNIRLNQKMIKELCGTVSFKRGEAFYRANKVTFEKYNPNRCEAIVSGTEDFQVVIERKGEDGFQSRCSCPKLASFQKDCQHIAAVLLAIDDYQRKGTIPPGASSSTINDEPDLAGGLLNIFNNQLKRSSGHQLHFENRQVLDAEFIIKPVLESSMFGIELCIGQTKVENIRRFLEAVNQGHSSDVLYDPSLHCFQKEADTVIQHLIQVVHDDQNPSDSTDTELLLIPPSSWKQLQALLTKVPLVKLEFDGHMVDGLSITDELPPLQFDFTEAESNGYLLKVKGLSRMILLDSYDSVLSAGKIIRMKTEDCQRLADVKQMLDASGTNQIFIPQEQIQHFFEKVIPGLKKLGYVQLSNTLAREFMRTPLIAKLYLDRVKNRLLAGLEFHYENIIVNPLEDRGIIVGARIIRDEEKENEILQLMEESSFTKTEGGYFLHNEELEYEFLTHVVPKLQKLVQIYATTAVRNRIFRGNTPPSFRVRLKRERTNWLEFKFELDGIPQQQIKEVLAALEEKRKYYRLRNGSLLSLESKEFGEIQRFLNGISVENKNLENGFEISILQGLPLLDSLDESHVLIVEDSFRQFLDNLRHPESLQFEVPVSLESVLRDYQKRGYQWLKTLAHYGFGGILADDMGLGKTLQSIAFILSELAVIREKKQPVLVVCPSSLSYNWLSEIMKFAPEIEAVVVDGNHDERVQIQKEAMGMDVIITSYPLLRRDIKWYEKQTFHTVFFDEAQAFKNPLTQTARAVKRLKADFRFALTGTPVENSSEELWSIFHVVFPELFKGLKEFSNLTRKKIARRVRPFLLRRMKKDVASELPEKLEFVEIAELLPEQKRLYAAYLAKLREDTLKHLDKDTIRKNRIKILAGLTRLRQICCHPVLFVEGYKGGSAKFDMLLRIIEESRLSGRRVLIFSQFTKMLELIGRNLALKGLPFFYLDGGTPSEKRLEICQRFNEGERDFFLISLKAGGTGLNLTGADTVILYDIWWNPAVEEQAADRAHRIGQKNVVQVIKLITRGTIEEKISELQDKKRHLIEEIIDSEERSSSALTEDDIMEILS